MKQKTATIGRPHLGRPREFDREDALQIAVKLFGKYGYEGVSIADLTQAMNISPPSLYAAFGSKEALYLEALESYQQHKNQLHIENPGSFRDQLEVLLRDTVRAATEPGYPAGCMVVAGMLNCAGRKPAFGQHVDSLAQRAMQGFCRTSAGRRGKRRAARGHEYPGGQPLSHRLGARHRHPGQGWRQPNGVVCDGRHRHVTALANAVQID